MTTTATDNGKLEHFIACLRAGLEGKTVEYLHPETGRWIKFEAQDCSYDAFRRYENRIAPEPPKVTPYTFETAPMIERVRRKDGRAFGLIYALPNYAMLQWSSSDSANYTYDEASTQLEFLDGRPYGIVQEPESEWPKWVFNQGSKELWRCDGLNGPVKFYYPVSKTETPSAYKGWRELLSSGGNTEIPASEAQAMIAAKQSEAKGVTL